MMMAPKEFSTWDPAVTYYLVTGGILLILLALIKFMETTSRSRDKRYGLFLK